MNAHHLHTVLVQFRVTFLTYFTALTDDDLATILQGPSETLLEVLQLRYGYTREQAKAEWNEFVLRHVDGHQAVSGSSALRGAPAVDCQVDLLVCRHKLYRDQRYTQSQAKVYPSLWPPYAMGWWRQASRERPQRERSPIR